MATRTHPGSAVDFRRQQSGAPAAAAALTKTSIDRRESQRESLASVTIPHHEFQTKATRESLAFQQSFENDNNWKLLNQG